MPFLRLKIYQCESDVLLTFSLEFSCAFLSLFSIYSFDFWNAACVAVAAIFLAANVDADDDDSIT